MNPPNFANHRILVVDDNRTMHDDFRKILAGERADRTRLDAAAAGLFGVAPKPRRAPTFQVDAAFQGADGAAMAEKAAAAGTPYAVAFVDMRMPPGWDGLDTIARLWEIEPDLQIVLCTAHSDYSLDQIQERTNAADRLIILKKPFETVEVLQLAYALTEKWRLQQLSRAKTFELEQMVEARTADLREANAHLVSQAQLIDLAHDAITVRDLEDRFSFWNAGAEKLYGWTAQEAMGRNIVTLLGPDPKTFEHAKRQVLDHGQWNGEFLYLTKDEREIHVSTHWTLLRDDAGEPKSVLAISSDITERRRLEQQFFRAQRLESIGTLASGLAHDLNNIIAPILMCAPLLRRNLPPEQVESLITTIESSASRGAQIVSQVLTFGRGVEGERKPLRIASIIGEVTQIASETFPKNIRIEHRTAPGLADILGDATQWHQVLLNLSVNARDAMPDGGVLRITADNFQVDAYYASMLEGISEGPHIAIEVSDTGSGIPPHVVERIFDPFYTTKKLGKGTGLGLSTVLGIVKDHGAAIDLKTRVGSGTTFRIIVPAADVASGAMPTAPEASFEGGLGETVLVVDDEENVRNAAAMVIELYGYHALLAADGTEALALYAQNASTIDAVLTDITMPFMDGVALIGALRRMQPLLPVIASTGQGENARLAELKELGIEWILQKPYSADLLLHTLGSAIHSARASVLV